MVNQDPLTELLFAPQIGRVPEFFVQKQQQVVAALDALEAALAQPAAKRGDLWGLGFSRYTQTPLPAGARARGEDLYRRLYAAGGNGSTSAQEGLLQTLALTAEPDSIPFWVEILDYARPRDRFTKTRRAYACAALAFLVIRRNDPAALAALRAATRHAHPDVRALAVEHLERAYGAAKLQAPPELLDELAERAERDAAFGPRYLARLALESLGGAVPFDHPGGVYAFKVTYLGDRRVTRTIELRAEDTLDDLHYAIQGAFEWDADHLYAFYLSEDRRDPRFEVVSPLEANDTGSGFNPLATLRILGPLDSADLEEVDLADADLTEAVAIVDAPAGLETGDEAEAADEDEDADDVAVAFSTATAVLGELGLPLKHKFLYLFDYGDDHEFEIQVVAIHPHAETGNYPRIVASTGAAPPQYEEWTDDEDEEDDGEDDDSGEDAEEDVGGEEDTGGREDASGEDGA